MAPIPELDEGLIEFLGRMGHDVIGPLNQASSLVALFVKRYRDQLDPDADLLLDFMQKASTRMESLAGGVRGYLTILKTAPVFQEVDCNAAFATAVSVLQPAVSETSAEVTSDTLPTIEADPHQVATLFEVIIDNALKFRDTTGPPRVHISATGSERNWIFRIQDNGIGIERDSLRTALLPFKRLNGAAYSGSGLGLAVAKLIVTLHAGRIWIESGADSDSPRGTAVFLSLPTSASSAQRLS